MADRSRRLLATLDRLTPSLRSSVRKALAALRARVDTEALAEALVSGDEFALRRLLSDVPRSLAPAVDVLRRAALAGSASSGLTVSFTSARPVAAKIAERSAASLVTNISRDTRQAIRVVLSEAFTKGVSPRDVAARIRPVIGLTGRQAKAVTAFRAAQVKKGVAAKTVTARVDRYAAKLLKQRSEMIARTEIISASTKGQVEAWTDARRRGVLADDLRKTWIVTPDDKLCPICAPLEGQQTDVQGLFRVNGALINGPPAHPNCRCAVGLVAAKKSARRAA